MSNEIMNAIRNAIESAVNDNGMNVSAVKKSSYADYVYGLFNTEVFTHYKANKRCKYDYQLLHTLLRLACESEISNILWFTRSLSFTVLVNAITNIIDD